MAEPVMEINENKTQDIINGMTSDARSLLATLAYELATNKEVIEGLNDEQKDIFSAILGQLIYDPQELPDDDEEEY